jgi:hypothetical protein
MNFLAKADCKTRNPNAACNAITDRVNGWPCDATPEGQSQRHWAEVSHIVNEVDPVTLRSSNRRHWLGAACAALGLAWLSACTKQPSQPPAIPYGQALDVSQAGTFVEFDFRIDKPDRYDVLLEVFQKDPKEHPPREVWDTPNAHFKVRLQSLAPGGEVLVEQEVKKAEGELQERGFGPSPTESTKLMSFRNFLVHAQPLNEGTFRVRVDNLNPMPALQGRLVKVSIQLKNYPK